jgi:hypothetical protein
MKNKHYPLKSNQTVGNRFQKVIILLKIQCTKMLGVTRCAAEKF